MLKIVLQSLPLKHYNNLENYEKHLIYFFAHHIRKTYLNYQFNVNLQEFDLDGALIIVDFKMRILSQSSWKMKAAFFEKRGWISIISDNSPHYHNSELIIILSHWYDWYEIEIRKWMFLEAGKAKTIIDSYYAQLTHAMKQYVRLGYKITEEQDIENAIQTLAETHIAYLEPNCENSLWPVKGENVGYILACALPHTGLWHYFSPEKITKIAKRAIEKPQPIAVHHTNPTKLWTVLIPRLLATNILENTMEMSDLTNDPECTMKTKSIRIFFAGWTLKEHQKSIQKWDIKLIPEQIKALLTTMFLNANQGEISKEDILKTSTIHNWIARAAASFKIYMLERTLEEAEASNIM
ncbi:hypothetical protein GLOIN_2v1790442 [Rhizophagus clarus]|uniref:Uncharacterized protein n=1 Tax=Rhizophagus clarus TaxID=94130 RepID=A0A8H3LRR8_9GLOM|nr:hypothetical protein GLOIN_2v1790442 [Rhizophagus clarus]